MKKYKLWETKKGNSKELGILINVVHGTKVIKEAFISDQEADEMDITFVNEIILQLFDPKIFYEEKRKMMFLLIKDYKRIIHKYYRGLFKRFPFLYQLEKDVVANIVQYPMIVHFDELKRPRYEMKKVLLPFCPIVATKETRYSNLDYIQKHNAFNQDLLRLSRYADNLEIPFLNDWEVFYNLYEDILLEPEQQWIFDYFSLSQPFSMDTRKFQKES